MSVIDPSLGRVPLSAIERCFGGAIPAVLATSSAEGVPNITYISRAHRVDDDRIALSNQFMSKTARNLAVNPRASLLLVDPVTFDQYRLSLTFERTERRGHLFERLRADIDALAVLEGMQDVYRLRAADVFRVLEIVVVPPNPAGERPDHVPEARPTSPDLAALAEVSGWIARAGDLDVLVGTVLEGLDRVLGYAHTNLLLLDETGRHLYTIASHGFDHQGIGAEVPVGQGHIGMVAERCEPLRVDSLRKVHKYSRSMRMQYEETGVRPGRDVPLPGVPDVESRILVPLMASGQLVGVLVAESRRYMAFGVADEQILMIVGTQLASAIETLRAFDCEAEQDGMLSAGAARFVSSVAPSAVIVDDVDVDIDDASDRLAVRYFRVDGSVFVDGDYLIKGVAGRIFWSILQQHVADGRADFTNRELRLDPTLELPGIKDNLESRLILLKRRLDERGLPIRIDKTGRGRFRLVVQRPVELDVVDE